MSKAIATFVRLGLESQENRRREFFRKLRENLASDDPKQQDRVVDEFCECAEDSVGTATTRKWAHLRDRAKEREIAEDDLFELAQWKARDPCTGGLLSLVCYQYHTTPWK